jgi:hypothetical protein
MTSYAINLILFWYVGGLLLSFLGAFLVGLGVSRLNRLKRETLEFQRFMSRETAELAKWQGELERKASSLREQKFYRLRYPR